MSSVKYFKWSTRWYAVRVHEAPATFFENGELTVETDDAPGGFKTVKFDERLVTVVKNKYNKLNKYDMCVIVACIAKQAVKTGML
jgi:hypothetical protein